MSEIFIDYDAKVQDALRGVVKTILSETAENGLQGEHHFYIAFKTQADGVDIPAHLKSRFPEEMTIVLQHKFWGLKVEDDYFEVGLSFNQNPEMLVVPFDAIVGFVDPSVQFALQFHDDQDADDVESVEDIVSAPQPEAAPKVADDAEDAEPTIANAVGADNGGDNVVTLDAFRKK